MNALLALIPTIIKSIVEGAAAHKTSTALGAAAISTALAIPSVTGDGLVVPSSMEEAIGQLVLAAFGVFAVWYKGRGAK